jgi:exodeoxyribonuclease VII large subunit
MVTATHNIPEYSVSELSGYVKRMVEETFGYVRVRGEVSQPNVNAGSGHCYLRLKDDKAMLEAVCWKGTMAKLKHKPEAGMEVIASGKLTTYPGSSKYQLVIESLEPAGVGALMAMLEERKKKLAAEGLFAPERKKPIPFLPEVIGIVTSPTGAVIRDILHRLSDRFPRKVLLWPVAVQGQAAAEQVAAAIAGFNAMPNPPDVLIVARGGGSIEDLWAFNEEVVVRAVAASQIPVISAVGHETDTTLIDYVSDRRAPTPTGAAEMAVPVREELLSFVETLNGRRITTMRKYLLHQRERVEGLARGLPRPQQLVGSMAQALDALADRLALALPRHVQMKTERFHGLADRLAPRLALLPVERAQARLNQLGAMLESLNVLAVLKRGYAIVKTAEGQVVPSAAALADGVPIRLQFHDGERNAVSGNGTKTKKGKTAGQPGLFDD